MEVPVAPPGPVVVPPADDPADDVDGALEDEDDGGEDAEPAADIGEIVWSGAGIVVVDSGRVGEAGLDKI